MLRAALAWQRASVDNTKQKWWQELAPNEVESLVFKVISTCHYPNN